jgi:hypothetical protein
MIDKMEQKIIICTTLTIILACSLVANPIRAQTVPPLNELKVLYDRCVVKQQQTDTCILFYGLDNKCSGIMATTAHKQTPTCIQFNQEQNAQEGLIGSNMTEAQKQQANDNLQRAGACFLDKAGGASILKLLQDNCTTS